MTKIMTNSIFRLILTSLFLSVIFISCNKDEVIETQSPGITFGEESGVYTVKTGRSITITPTVSNATNPKYIWKMDGTIIGSTASYTFSNDKTGEYFITFRVEADNGYAEEEIRIDVVEKMTPVISLAIPEDGHFTAVKGQELEIVAQVKFGQGSTHIWKLNNTVVTSKSDSLYVFKQNDLGDYTLSLTVISDEDGQDEVSTTVKVVEALPLEINFENENENGIVTMTASLNRALYITPVIINDTENTSFQWYQDNTPFVEETGKILKFIPDQIRDYQIKIVGTTPGQAAVEKSITVKCVAAEGEFYREATASSKAEQNKVYKFLPAPGQFVNEGYTATTMAAANAYAEQEMKKGQYVSLGGFGGYIVVGFDHSILNISKSYDGKYDFAIDGNSFPGSSEPGIVWVMQDENGNGLPDDTWYELKGSEHGKAETIQNYAITYYKPAAPGMDVQWKDNRGKSGAIKYMKQFHTQDYYYPEWVTTGSYTLRGTCLECRNYQDGNGTWINDAYDWGYADNFGEDKGSNDNNSEANPNANYFKISNAVYADGSPVELYYIDFIKVQTGVNAQSGWIGEVSTEVFGFKDLNINK